MPGDGEPIFGAEAETIAAAALAEREKNIVFEKKRYNCPVHSIFCFWSK